MPSWPKARTPPPEIVDLYLSALPLGIIPHSGWVVAPRGWRVIHVAPGRLVCAPPGETAAIELRGGEWSGAGHTGHPTPDWNDLATRLLLCHLADRDGTEEDVLRALSERRHHRPIRRLGGGA